jgi:hypothetical protein
MPPSRSPQLTSSRLRYSQPASSGPRSRFAKPRLSQRTKIPTPPVEESNFEDCPANIDDDEEDGKDEDDEEAQEEDEPDLRFDNISIDELCSRP